MNNNPSEWEKEDKGSIKLCSLNCRSLRKHHPDIISDDILLKSDIICLQETWLEDGEQYEDLNIPNYELHLNSNGKGKGLAIYFKKDILRHEADIKEENIQISKFTSSDMDLLVLYRSQTGNLKLLKQYLENTHLGDKPLLVIGDFNFCFLKESPIFLKKYFNENSFSQLVNGPTHIEGNLLDQAHMRDTKRMFKCSIELHSKYYTDHKGVALLIKRYDDD
jgi:exonuclease III